MAGKIKKSGIFAISCCYIKLYLKPFFQIRPSQILIRSVQTIRLVGAILYSIRVSLNGSTVCSYKMLIDFDINLNTNNAFTNKKVHFPLFKNYICSFVRNKYCFKVIISFSFFLYFHPISWRFSFVRKILLKKLFLFPGSRTPFLGFLLYVQYLAGCRDSNPSCCDCSQMCYQQATRISL